MSYYGNVKSYDLPIKKGMGKEEVKQELARIGRLQGEEISIEGTAAEMCQAMGLPFDIYFYEGENDPDVEIVDYNWRNPYVEEMEVYAPLFEDGAYIEFCGEDNDIFRISFYGDSAVEDSAETIYSDDGVYAAMERGKVVGVSFVYRRLKDKFPQADIVKTNWV